MDPGRTGERVANPESKSYQQHQPGDGDESFHVRGLFPVKSGFLVDKIFEKRTAAPACEAVYGSLY